MTIFDWSITSISEFSLLVLKDELNQFNNRLVELIHKIRKTPASTKKISPTALRQKSIKTDETGQREVKYAFYTGEQYNSLRTEENHLK